MIFSVDFFDFLQSVVLSESWRFSIYWNTSWKRTKISEFSYFSYHKGTKVSLPVVVSCPLLKKTCYL